MLNIMNHCELIISVVHLKCFFSQSCRTHHTEVFPDDGCVLFNVDNCENVKDSDDNFVNNLL